GDVRVRAGGVPAGEVGLEARVADQGGGDGDRGGRGGGLSGGVFDRGGDRVRARGRIGVGRGRIRLRADRRRAVAEVEAVASDRGRVGVGRAGGIGGYRQRQRPRRRVDREGRVRRQIVDRHRSGRRGRLAAGVGYGRGHRVRSGRRIRVGRGCTRLRADRW